MRFTMLKKELKRLYFRFWYTRLRIEHFLAEKRYNQKKSKDVQKSLELSDKSMKLPVTIVDVKDDKKGIVTIISDDGFFDSGVILNELANKYDICATDAGAVSIVKPHLKEWQKIIAEGHIEMVNHSYKHVAMQEGREISKDRDRLYYEIVRAKQWITHHFKGLRQFVFVCPGNMMCELGYEVLSENDFLAVRRGNRGYNSLSPENGTNEGEWFNLMVQGIGDEGVDTSVRNSWVDYAIQNRQWLIEMWHNVAAQDDGFYQTIMKEDAEKHIDYIAKSKKENQVWVATFSEAVKYLREKQSMIVEAYLTSESIHILANLKSKKLSKEIFDYPVTIKIALPDYVADSSFYMGEEELTLIDKKMLMLNVVPNGEPLEIAIRSKRS